MTDAARSIGAYESADTGGGVIWGEDRAHSSPGSSTAGDVISWADVLVRAGRKPRKYPIWGITIYQRPFEVTVTKSGEIWSAENEEFGIFVFGDSVADALSEAAEAFRYLYDELVDEDEERLSEYSKVLRAKYLEANLD